jgi:hypothetical protein
MEETLKAEPVDEFLYVFYELLVAERHRCGLASAPPPAPGIVRDHGEAAFQYGYGVFP